MLFLKSTTTNNFPEPNRFPNLRLTEKFQKEVYLSFLNLLVTLAKELIFPSKVISNIITTTPYATLRKGLLFCN